MYVCICVCMYICMFVYMYVFINVSMYACMFMCVCMYLCMFVYTVYISKYVYMMECYTRDGLICIIHNSVNILGGVEVKKLPVWA